MADTDSWDESCAWPRRLLHVETMTSYKWRPGNIYGNDASPRYNALSYTWGRWMLKDNAKSEVKALPIKGITWQVPRVDPGHFTTDELLSIIRTTTQDDASHGGEKVRFLWLDVACIDQTPFSDENASEVGRQAKIFAGATKVFAWLTSFESVSAFDNMISRCLTHYAFLQISMNGGMAANHIPNFEVEPEEIAKHISEELSALIQEPWSTSMWTLQEAFMRPDLTFLARKVAQNEFILPTLDSTFNWANNILGLSQYHRTNENSPVFVLGDTLSKLGFVLAGHVKRLEPSLDDVGIDDTNRYLAGPSENPFHLLKYCKARTTAREEDRVYAIMQAFGFRLGKSAPGATRTEFTTQELNQQLYSALLGQFPIASQLMVQPRQCKTPHGWILHPDGIVSTAGEGFWAGLGGGNRVRNMAVLNSRSSEGEFWGHFRGPAASFAALHKRYGPLHVEVDMKWRADPPSGLAAQSSMAPRPQGQVESSPSADAEAGMIQRAIERMAGLDNNVKLWDSWVAQKFPDLLVLLLGFSYMPKDETPVVGGIGLCLNPREARSGDKYYERVGAVIWTHPLERSSGNEWWRINGNQEFWQPNSEGFFG